MSSPFPREGLAAYWSLDEASGTRYDRLGRSHLTDHNGVSAAAGRVFVGARFAQVNSQYLSVASNPALEIGEQDFTLTAWINLAQVSACVVVGKDASNGRDYSLEVTAAGRAAFRVFRPNDEVLVTSSGPDLLADAWAFLIARYDAAAETISIQVNDGPIEPASTAGVKPNITAAEFRIGCREKSPIADYFSGTIDEVGIWRRVLAPLEGTVLFNTGAGLPYPPPVTLAEALRSRLRRCPPVAAIVGDRIYTLRFPQSVTAPAVRLHEIDRVSAVQLRGDVAIRRARVQVDAIEHEAHGPDPYDGAHRLADAVRGDLKTGTPSGLAGLAGLESGITILAVLPDDERERYDPDARMIRVEQDFIVWFHV